MTLKTFFTLVRIPTAFSSMSNVYAGYLIGGGRWDVALVPGLFAGAAFIMGGMALNDVADAGVDARERPSRPIPSGATSRAAALRLGLGLIALGLLLVGLANPLALLPAGLLAACIGLYNFIFKGGPYGPFFMGGCRALNLATGMVLAWETWPRLLGFDAGAAVALASLLAYVMLVTYLAHEEVRGISWRRLRLFQAGLLLWALAWFAIGLFVVETSHRFYLLVVLALLAAGLFRPLRTLALEPTAKSTGKTVGAMLRFIPLVDVMAMLANQVDTPWALSGLLWILPGYIVGRYFYST